ncbi:MAG: hypothetical protein HC923_07980 [Myxococcales bacterium]|nr:hypothetical protein [Myxococcales bacterium]
MRTIISQSTIESSDRHARTLDLSDACAPAAFPARIPRFDPLITLDLRRRRRGSNRWWWTIALGVLLVWLVL